MSALDRWGDCKTPCPKCGGTVGFWSFDVDCRGNDGSGGKQCKSCKYDLIDFVEDDGKWVLYEE